MERDIERIFVRGVRDLGGIAFKFVSPGHDGVPDRLVVMPGGHVSFVELKTETGRPTKRQSFTIGQLTALGCDCRILYGAADVKDYLVELAFKKSAWEAENGI